ncbi:helix-turn-helix transcriptional regulator [Kocuria coralli]|uniref:Helix-turn-helix transcriptional regulator n=1 Tax=Kocuria coralli TaxID=1461025 RepID=A0A5J5KYW8_9MICC|nr:winged helix-turn-helix domain-containing protein [Kocuria coralli]KAA9394530.1 helix-turn-helix transcriptional regulator [Kocuria coralli]
MDEELDQLRERLEALTERVAALESAAPPVEAATSSPSTREERFWALTGLETRLADHPETSDGEVMLVGSLTLPTGAPVSWQQSAGTAGLLEVDWSERAAAFAALGHPVRIELLRHILSGVHATADLAAMETLGTTGQLHHHLRQLVAAGWVRQSGRGSYQIPAARIVPLLACMIGVER